MKRGKKHRREREQPVDAVSALTDGKFGFSNNAAMAVLAVGFACHLRMGTTERPIEPDPLGVAVAGSGDVPDRTRAAGAFPSDRLGSMEYRERRLSIACLAAGRNPGGGKLCW
jgi:hypothetical protein